MKKLISIVTTISILIGVFSQTPINALSQEDLYNKFLEETGMPIEEIMAMDEAEKEIVYNTLAKDESIKYVNSSLLSTEGKIKAETDEVSVVPYGMISSSDLEISVKCWMNGDKLKIYPSYEWKKPIKPKGKDSFAYTTTNSYSIVPNVRSNNVFWKDDWQTYGKWLKMGTLDYSSVGLSGYTHQGQSLGNFYNSAYVKAYCHYAVDIDSSNPVNKIFISYVHDTSGSGNLSYGISLGPLSISITPYNSSVQYMTQAYYLNY